MEYVVFTETNARIVKTLEPLINVKSHYVVLKDPDKSLVSGHPLEYWKPDVENNKVLPMDKDERSYRYNQLNKLGAINEIFHKPQAEPSQIAPVIEKKSFWNFIVSLWKKLWGSK